MAKQAEWDASGLECRRQVVLHALTYLRVQMTALEEHIGWVEQRVDDLETGVFALREERLGNKEW
jgi:hypothetical protein